MNKLSKRTLVIASGNVGKIKEFTKFLPKDMFEIIAQPANIKVNETGKTFRDNARLKAIEVANVTNQLSLADDSGLSVQALNGAPGIYSARYASTDSDRIERLLDELFFVQDRSAIFTAALCLASPNKEVLIEVEGTCKGVITKKPRGQKGFGYDPVFEVLGTGLTYAEMNPVFKEKVSHRGEALSMLMPKLNELISTSRI